MHPLLASVDSSTCEVSQGLPKMQADRVEETMTAAEARDTLTQALVTGKVKKMPCEVCGIPESQGHHHDYNLPLDVKWLCQSHHSAEHRRLRESGVIVPGSRGPRRGELTEVVRVRVSKQEHKNIIMAATIARRSVSDFIRLAAEAKAHDELSNNHREQ